MIKMNLGAHATRGKEEAMLWRGLMERFIAINHNHPMKEQPNQ